MHVVLPMLLELFKDVTVQVQQGEGARTVSTVPLLSQLTMQQDIDGSTPLHLAASLDWFKYAWLINERFKYIWPWSKSTATLLLDANICSAYQPDSKGLYPIHIAVSQVLLQRCPQDLVSAQAMSAEHKHDDYLDIYNFHKFT